MSDYAGQIIAKMIGGSNVMEVAAAQALYVNTTNVALKDSETTKQDGAIKYTAALESMKRAGIPDTDPAFIAIKALLEGTQGGIMDKWAARILEMQQPKSGGLF